VHKRGVNGARSMEDGVRGVKKGMREAFRV
jgi:hypothetical protein